MRATENRDSGTECSIRSCSFVRKIPPKLSVSDLMGHLKGRTAIRLFNKFPYLRKQHKLWGNHFSARGYCAVGVNAEMVRKYVKYQEKQVRR